MKTIRKVKETTFNYRLPEMSDLVPGTKLLAVPMFRGVDPEADPKKFSAVVELADPLVEERLGNEFVSYRFLKSAPGPGRTGLASVLLTQFLGHEECPIAFWMEADGNQAA